MIGLKRNTVKLVAHSRLWKLNFDKEKTNLKKIIGEYIIDIQHVGSTAIKGIPAKPVIDIVILVNKINIMERIRIILQGNGYEYRGDGLNKGGHLFVKNSAPDIRTHHIHIVEQSDIQWHNYLLFRDKLNKDRKLALQYSKLKKKLEKKHHNNREKYTQEKNNFIKSVIADAE
jgi:GrpB-like predicted nucleotidyltransferase (UPF0157 family)